MKKKKMPKIRVPIAPPTQRHKTEKDYDRKKEKEETKEEIEKLKEEKDDTSDDL